MVGAFLVILLRVHFSSPVKGIINTTTAIPLGMNQNYIQLPDFRGGLTFAVDQELSIFSTRCTKACIIPQNCMVPVSEIRVK